MDGGLTHEALAAFVDAELACPVSPEVAAFAGRLAVEPAVAVLFYGSALRTGELDGVLDFYVLTGRPHRHGLRGLVERRIWPEVSYRELVLGGRTLRAKIATMTLAEFRAAAEGARLDTTVWARFVQPCALVWARDGAAAVQVRESIMSAAVTASCFAAALGPRQGTPLGFWKALFGQTYAAEFRVEKSGREDHVLAYDRDRYDRLLPLAWRAGGVEFASAGGGELRPSLGGARLARLRRAWRARQRFGKPLNVARLIKAAFTFEGAARYAAYKLERHTGFRPDLTPWRERHPILAAPGVLWRLSQARNRERSRLRRSEAGGG